MAVSEPFQYSRSNPRKSIVAAISRFEDFELSGGGYLVESRRSAAAARTDANSHFATLALAVGRPVKLVFLSSYASAKLTS